MKSCSCWHHCLCYIPAVLSSFLHDDHLSLFYYVKMFQFNKNFRFQHTRGGQQLIHNIEVLPLVRLAFLQGGDVWSVGFGGKLTELKSRKHTQVAWGQNPKEVTQKTQTNKQKNSDSALNSSSSSCIFLPYYTLSLWRECAGICDKNRINIVGGF